MSGFFSNTVVNKFIMLIHCLSAILIYSYSQIPLTEIQSKLNIFNLCKCMLILFELYTTIWRKSYNLYLNYKSYDNDYISLVISV